MQASTTQVILTGIFLRENPRIRACRKILLLASLWVVSLGALACPQGYMPVGGAQNPGCIPNPQAGNGQQQAAGPTTMWSPRWGAIAYSPVVAIWGAAANKFSVEEAEAIALRVCQELAVENGADDGECSISTTVGNGCIAIASGGDKYSYSSESNKRYMDAKMKRSAEKIAMKRCSKGGFSCEIIYSECSYYEIVPIQ